MSKRQTDASTNTPFMWVKFRIMRQCRRPYCRLSPQRKRKLKTSSRLVICKYGRRRWRLEKWHLLLCMPGSGDVELVRRKNWHKNLKFKIRTHISIGIIYLFIFIFGIIGNGLVLYGFSKNRKLRQSISNSYMIHLAVTDLLFVSGFIFILYSSDWWLISLKKIHFLSLYPAILGDQSVQNDRVALRPYRM